MREKYCRLFVFAVFAAFLIGATAISLPAVAQQCSDGIDNDLDGFTDYPADLGCTSAADDSELDAYRIGGYQLPTYAEGVDISGSYAYAVYNHGGLAVFDVTDPSTPVLVGQDTEFTGNDIEVSGTHAYVVSENDSMLYVVDISDPTSPALVGSCAVTNVQDPNALTVSGSFVYVGAYQYENMQIFDVSDPANPHLEGELIDSRVSCQDIVVAGGYAYCPSYTISVIDVSNPAAPSFVRTVNTGGTENHWMYGITVSGSTLYATGCYLMVTYDLTDPQNPSLLGEVDAGSNCGMRVEVDGGNAFIAQQGDGMAIVDVSNPSAPFEAGVVGTTNGSTEDVAVSGSYAYLANGEDGFRTADVSTPSAPLEIGAFNETTWFIDVVKSGGFAYAADPDGSLVVLDVSDVTSPTEVGSYDTGGWPKAVAVAGDYAFVADGDLGLVVVGVDVPSHPTWASTTTLTDEPVAIQVVGDYAFIADGPSGNAELEIYDISDPGAPSFVARTTFDSAWLAGGLDVEGDFAYVSLGPDVCCGDTGPNALGIVDVSNVLSPNLVTQYTFLADGSDVPQGVDVADGLAYVATRDGLFVVDVSTPASPAAMGSTTESYLTDVKVSDGRAYVSSASSAVQVYNVTDPTAPYLVGAYDGAQHYGRGLVVDGGIAYVAADYDGLQIIGFDGILVFKDGFESGNTASWSQTFGATP